MLTVGTIGIQQVQPQVYEALTKDLTPDEKSVIAGVFQEAEQKMLEREAQMAAAVAAQTLSSNGA